MLVRRRPRPRPPAARGDHRPAHDRPGRDRTQRGARRGERDPRHSHHSGCPARRGRRANPRARHERGADHLRTARAAADRRRDRARPRRVPSTSGSAPLRFADPLRPGLRRWRARDQGGPRAPASAHTPPTSGSAPTRWSPGPGSTWRWWSRSPRVCTRAARTRRIEERSRVAAPGGASSPAPQGPDAQPARAVGDQDRETAPAGLFALRADDPPARRLPVGGRLPLPEPPRRLIGAQRGFVVVGESRCILLERVPPRPLRPPARERIEPRRRRAGLPAPARPGGGCSCRSRCCPAGAVSPGSCSSPAPGCGGRRRSSRSRGARRRSSGQVTLARPEAVSCRPANNSRASSWCAAPGPQRGSGGEEGRPALRLESIDVPPAPVRGHQPPFRSDLRRRALPARQLVLWNVRCRERAVDAARAARRACRSRPALGIAAGGSGHVSRTFRSRFRRQASGTADVARHPPAGGTVPRPPLADPSLAGGRDGADRAGDHSRHAARLRLLSLVAQPLDGPRLGRAARWAGAPARTRWTVRGGRRLAGSQPLASRPRRAPPRPATRPRRRVTGRARALVERRRHGGHRAAAVHCRGGPLSARRRPAIASAPSVRGSSPSSSSSSTPATCSVRLRLRSAPSPGLGRRSGCWSRPATGSTGTAARRRRGPWPSRPEVRRERTCIDLALAVAATWGLGGDLRNPAPLDPDRRQGPAQPGTLAQPLLGGHALRHGSWPDHRADPPWREGLPARLRLPRPPAARRHRRRRTGRRGAGAAERRDFYARAHGPSGGWAYRSAIDRMPNELDDATPFDLDEQHRSLRRRERRDASGGRCSRPTGCCDGSARASSASAARCTSSGAASTSRSPASRADRHPLQQGAPPHLPLAVAQEAYSHEVSSAGFWPGTVGGPVDYPAFYSYAYPAPEGFGEAPIAPRRGRPGSEDLGEFVLPWDAVRQARRPGGHAARLPAVHLRGGGRPRPPGTAPRSSARKDLHEPQERPQHCPHVDELAPVEPRTPEGCEECLTTRQRLGAPAPLPRVRPCRLLRQLAPPPRDRPLPRHRSRRDP